MTTEHALMAHNQPFLGTKLQPRQGIGAGLVAGTGMIIVWTVGAAFFGPGAASLINTIAATFLGDSAIGSSWQLAAIMVGLLIHYVLSILLGILFAASLDRLDRRNTLVVSSFYGFTIWFVSSFIVAGWFNELIVQFSRNWWGLVAYLIFGLLLGVFAVRRGTPPPVLSPD
ncbi:MAG: hypothetical protein GY759_03795 [Chloroflexi bacterium]|nr:hypothetical protein [Chloroflexota bacterium]